MEDPKLNKSKQFNLLNARLTLGVLIFVCSNFRKTKENRFREYLFLQIVKSFKFHMYLFLRILTLYLFKINLFAPI